MAHRYNQAPSPGRLHGDTAGFQRLHGGSAARLLSLGRDLPHHLCRLRSLQLTPRLTERIHTHLATSGPFAQRVAVSRAFFFFGACPDVGYPLSTSLWGRMGEDIWRVPTTWWVALTLSLPYLDSSRRCMSMSMSYISRTPGGQQQVGVVHQGAGKACTFHWCLSSLY